MLTGLHLVNWFGLKPIRHHVNSESFANLTHCIISCVVVCFVQIDIALFRKKRNTSKFVTHAPTY